MSLSSGHLLIPVQPGDRVADRYTVERVVGTGGMGVVVAARHEQLGQTVAIKILTVSTDVHPEAVDRFLREARAAASLRSEHIARVMDAGTDDRGRHFIVMEYLEGEDLASVVRRGETLSIGQVVGYLLQACEALAEAHTQGIIHRDLKPENIFLTRRVDGSPLIKVLDFGISKMTDIERADGSLSGSNPRSLLGSPLYMSPEQIRTPWDIDPRSDVWALGVILFELLTGRRPFQGQSLNDIFASILVEDPPDPLALRPDLPPPLADIMRRCLEKEIENRIPSVGALAQLLHDWAPRWARDSSNRAARVAGMTTQPTGSMDVSPLAAGVAQTGGGRTSGVNERPASRTRALITALVIGGLACGGLTALALWAHRRVQAQASTAAAAVSAVKADTVDRPAARGEPIPPAAESPQEPHQSIVKADDKAEDNKVDHKTTDVKPAGVVVETENGPNAEAGTGRRPSDDAPAAARAWRKQAVRGVGGLEQRVAHVRRVTKAAGARFAAPANGGTTSNPPASLPPDPLEGRK